MSLVSLCIREHIADRTDILYGSMSPHARLGLTLIPIRSRIRKYFARCTSDCNPRSGQSTQEKHLRSFSSSCIIIIICETLEGLEEGFSVGHYGHSETRPPHSIDIAWYTCIATCPYAHASPGDQSVDPTETKQTCIRCLERHRPQDSRP